MVEKTIEDLELQLVEKEAEIKKLDEEIEKIEEQKIITNLINDVGEDPLTEQEKQDSFYKPEKKKLNFKKIIGWTLLGIACLLIIYASAKLFGRFMI